MALSPSQRILLAKEISKRLENEEWPLLDLTLNQFDLPTPDEFSGTKLTYVLQNIRGASDDALLDLAQHLGFILDSAKRTAIEPSFWEPGNFRLFLSHLATHRNSVGQIQLLKFGISSFVAHKDIEPSEEWQIQIELALATCEGLVALLHQDFHASKWTDQEIGFAMGRSVPVFSVRLGENPYGFIGRFQAFQGVNKTAGEIARELFDCLRKNKQTQKRMSEVLVRLFEHSSSFATAKTRIAYLEQLESWEQAFSDRIKAAVKANDQIEHSFGVSGRVDALIKKWE